MPSSRALPQSDPVLQVNIAQLNRTDGEPLLHHIHFSVREGERLVIIGPNGSGKTSLLRAMCRELSSPPQAIQLNGACLATFSRQQLATCIAVMAQNDMPDLRLSVEEYVALGRIPHLRACPAGVNQRIVHESIDETGLSALKTRPLAALSGGERQRAALARVLAQKPLLILLDEPANHLDPLARQQLLALIKNKGITAIAVLHDLSLIDTFADRVLILSQGEQIVCDHPSRALTSRYLQPVFGLNSFTVKHPASGKRLRIFEVPDCA
ncbi:ABC transporter ATP-binding protein [Pantoea stewartii]|uniref:ABC transporter ATP-binding protein n=1 Tax=Pantoea stewartii TaxID=66269 RepID=UPI00138FA65A|nr:ABC transporter ATP-binding protein [Pantoea stewartii]